MLAPWNPASNNLSLAPRPGAFFQGADNFGSGATLTKGTPMKLTPADLRALADKIEANDRSLRDALPTGRDLLSAAREVAALMPCEGVIELRVCWDEDQELSVSFNLIEHQTYKTLRCATLDAVLDTARAFAAKVTPAEQVEAALVAALPDELPL